MWRKITTITWVIPCFLGRLRYVSVSGAESHPSNLLFLSTGFHCYFHRSICGSNMCQSKPWGINNTSWKTRLTKSGVELYIKVYNNHYVIQSRSDLSHRCYPLNIFLRIKELTFDPNLFLFKIGSCSWYSLMIASSIKKGNKKYTTGTFWIANTLSIAITR